MRIQGITGHQEDGGKARYTQRPLNHEEREFAAENHTMVYEYMKYKKLDAGTFYDELIFDYLTAVKKYVTEKPELQSRYPFKQILFQQLNGRMMHYWREYYNKKNTIEREAARLDDEYEDHKQERHGRMEPWWIDPMQNVERYVVEKEFIHDVYANIHRYAEPDLLLLIVNMRREGYGNFSIAKEAKASLPDYSDWGVREIADLIRIMGCCHNSPLQRLYRDTKEWGNLDRHQEWEEARESW